MAKKTQKNNDNLVDDEKEFISSVDSARESKKKAEKKDDKRKSNDKPANMKLAKQKAKKDNFNKLIDSCNDNYKAIIGFVVGLVVGLLILVLVWPDRIATLKDGTQPVVTIDGKNITADDLYETMKDSYSISLLIDSMDEIVLGALYEEDDKMKESIQTKADYYYNVYEETYQTSKSDFLSQNGFDSEEEFLDYLRLSYRRNLYLEDYIKDNLKDSEIEDYYKDNVVGDINCQHMYVSTSDDLDDEAAQALIQEIIDKLNEGTSWEDVQKEYSESATFEDLGYESWDANLESSFLEELKSLEDNSYSQTPVSTSYGYHVIYRLDSQEKPSLEDSREAIIDKLIEEKQAADSDLLYKALIAMREEHEIDFSDSLLKEDYDEYCKQYK